MLSEIYYPNGWKAFINGKETKIFKTNNLLRSVVVPSGLNKIEFVYDSSTYRSGLMISYIGWVLTFLLILSGIIAHKRMKVTNVPIVSENA